MSTPDVRSHTAIHVVKGAVFKVLGAKWSASAYSSGTHGGLAVQLDRKPTDEEMAKVEELANTKVAEDQPIEIHELGRSDAEAKWGNAIYDLFPIPESITTLKVFNLPEWNVNTCGKDHTARTGEVGRIRISKWRFKAQKNLLELSFDLE